MLDEINEQTDQMQQIQDAMAQPIGPAADVDEDELMGELEVPAAPFILALCMPCQPCLGPASDLLILSICPTSMSWGLRCSSSAYSETAFLILQLGKMSGCKVL